jgi:hypothetical protein
MRTEITVDGESHSLTEGDVVTNALVKEWAGLVDEHGYDDALDEFIRLYADEAVVYTIGKTRATRGGITASEEFGNWERNHSGFVNRHRDVAAFFAPGGSDFDFAVYQRQLRSGTRERLSAREILEETNAVLGRRRYEALEAEVAEMNEQDGHTTLSDEQRTWLAERRREIADRYAGFDSVARFEVWRTAARIDDLRVAVDDPAVADNETAYAVATYLDVRDQVLAEARNRGFTTLGGKNVADLREYLRVLGDKLIAQDANFSRVWRSVFAYEVAEK